MVVYTKSKKKILRGTVWNGDITDTINCNFFEGGVVLLLPLQELSA